MIELDSNCYKCVLPLLDAEMIDTVYARVVMEGKEKGSVYVDDTLNPSVCLVIHKVSGFSILSGSDRNIRFNNEIKRLLLENDPNRGRIKLFVSGSFWKETIEKLLGDNLYYYEEIKKNCQTQSEIDKELETLSKNNVIGRERTKFIFDEQAFKDKVFTVPDGFIMKRIDNSLLGRLTGNVVPASYWSSEENFLQYGMGFCLLKDEEIVSTAFSAFAANKTIDIGIETAYQYRGKGLGVFPAAEMIRYSLDNGLYPVWGCRKDNLSSGKLAEKLCYKKVLDHPWYFSITG